MTFWKMVQMVCSIGGLFVLCLWLTIEILKRAGPWLKKKKKKESCRTCGFLFDASFDMFDNNYYCEINDKKIDYPREMGGIDKCPCYMNKAEYKKENKRKIIDNHVYPQKSKIKKEAEE